MRPAQERHARFWLLPTRPVPKTGKRFLKRATFCQPALRFFRSGKATCLFFPEEAVKENFYQDLDMQMLVEGPSCHFRSRSYSAEAKSKDS